MRILAAIEPVDFRKGIDGLAAVCKQKLQKDPFSGVMFVFVNKSRQALRLLVYDGQGFWLCHKRLSSGRLRWLQGSDNAAPDAPLEWRPPSPRCAGSLAERVSERLSTIRKLKIPRIHTKKFFNPPYFGRDISVSLC
jgi:transposase